MKIVTTLPASYDPIAASSQRFARRIESHVRLMAAIDRLKVRPAATSHVTHFEQGDRMYWRRRHNELLRDQREARRCRTTR